MMQNEPREPFNTNRAAWIDARNQAERRAGKPRDQWMSVDEFIERTYRANRFESRAEPQAKGGE